jgi:hypothetical protein
MDEKIAPKVDKLLTPKCAIKGKLEAAYRNLIELRQFKRCYEFILAEVTDERWFSSICEPMDVSDRIEWLGRAKSVM